MMDDGAEGTETETKCRNFKASQRMEKIESIGDPIQSPTKSSTYSEIPSVEDTDNKNINLPETADFAKMK